MGIFDNENKQRKQELVTLQNIVLNINERKLQVSEEFLMKMTKIYVSKYMKVINEHSADLNKLSNLGLLFRKYDVIMSNLEELIAIEKLYRFNKPTPTEYKEQLESCKSEFINSLIAREWKKVSPARELVRNDPEREKKYRKFFESFEQFDDKLPDASKKYLQRIYEGVFEKKEPENEMPVLNDKDEFVPEEFETLSMEMDIGEADINSEEMPVMTDDEEDVQV